MYLKGKLSAFDFIGALHCLSDNTFPQQIGVCIRTTSDYQFTYLIQDPSLQFRLMHVWHFLNATKCQGQAHGINLLLPRH